MAEVTTYQNSIRTVSFDGYIALLLPGFLAQVVQQINPGNLVLTITFENADSNDVEFGVPFGPGEWKSLAAAYNAWLNNTVLPYSVDFNAGDVKCRLNFNVAALRALFNITQQFIAQTFTPAQLAILTLPAPLSITFLTEAYRGGDLGNGFGDPISGFDD